MSRPRRRLWAVACMVLFVASCGGGGTTGQAPTGSDLPACPVDALDTATGPVEVVVWHTQQAKPLEALQQLVNHYNASQNRVRVRLENQGTSYDELQRKFATAVPSRQLPALIMVDDTFTKSMADSGVVLPAQSCIDAEGYDTSGFVETAKSYYTIDGVLWPASANLGSVLLFYNRAHFRAAGLDPDRSPSTLAEVREYAERIKAASVVDRPLVHELASWKTEFWLTGAGSAVVDNRNGRGAGETTAATLTGNREALQLYSWFQQMNADGLLTPVPSVPGQIDQYLAMANRQASMMVESSSAATSVEAFLGGNLDPSQIGAEGFDPTRLSGLDIGAGPFPALGEQAIGKTQMGGAAWYLINTVPEPVQAAAWDFMKFMNTPQAQAVMLTGGSYLPYVKATNDRPEVRAFYTGSLAGRWLKIANDQIAAIDPTFPGPLIGPYYEFREAVRKSQDALIFSGRSPEEALDQAQREVDAAIARYNETDF